MKKNNLYVDIHVLQNVPPSCINRDDTGSPKTAKYGGTVRARVSSQAWKHEMRKMFEEIFDKEDLGIRTPQVPQLIADEIQRINKSIDSNKAMNLATKVFKDFEIKFNKNKGKENQTAALLFVSRQQIRELSKYALNNKKDKKEFEKAMTASPSIDIALFGRMVANSEKLSVNVDAAAQVAHVFSTHTVHNEYDYFTATDDLEKKSGADFLGVSEFNSATLYRYATVNAAELKKTLGASAADAVKGFAEAFIKSMPTGKQNTFANRTVPDFVYITLRTDQPINLCGAYEKPISGKEGGYLKQSEKALIEYGKEIYKKYACEPEKSWNLEEKSLPQILEELYSGVKEKLSESEDE